MSESVDTSSNRTFNPGYISTTQAISYLEEILQDETIDETVTARILEKFSQNLENSSQNLAEFQTLSIMVSASEDQVEIIGPEGFEYTFNKVNNECITSIKRKFTGQFDLTPSACRDPGDCPTKPGKRTRVLIPQSGQSPMIDTIMIESLRDWMMEGQVQSIEGQVQSMDQVDTPTFPEPKDPGGSKKPTSMDPTDTPPTQ